jgi:hypothetical protein
MKYHIQKKKYDHVHRENEKLKNECRPVRKVVNMGERSSSNFSKGKLKSGYKAYVKSSNKANSITGSSVEGIFDIDIF